MEPILYEEKEVLRNLMNLFQYDLSEFTKEAPNALGRFEYRYMDHYWTEEGRDPFWIVYEKERVGLVLVNEVLDTNPDKKGKCLAEFFILRNHRRKGIGRATAQKVFDAYPGYWEVSYVGSNLPAQQFWRRVVGEYTQGRFEEISVKEEWEGSVLVFST